MKGLSRRLARLEAQAGNNAWEHGAGLSALLRQQQGSPPRDTREMEEEMRSLQERPWGIGGLLWDISHGVDAVTLTE